MRCPRCHTESPPQAKFCLECASPLARACPSCGTPLPPTAKFCPECAQPVPGREPAPGQPRFASPQAYTPRHLAEKILTSRSALEGERKQVTVLFADLKGSMELLADRDPEEARTLLDPVLERMMEAVHRYEGTVNQVMGDGIMALFGAPVAHEDHAVRACYAALDMQAAIRRYADEVWRTHGIKPQIRVGLNSGEVVVRAIGSDLHLDYTAVGQTTHLAARMEQLADPGASLVTAETLRLTEGFVTVTPLGSVPIKGLEAPVEVYALTGAGPLRSRLHAAAARGLTRFVGREGELEQLRQALARAGAGHGQVVAVVGEPGVGKSRLYWEFSRSWGAQGWLVLESGSVSYGKATNYLSVLGLLRAYFAIETTDDPREIREKVTGKLLSLDRRLERCLVPILWLLDVAIEDESWQRLDPPQRRRRILDGVKRLLLHESQVQPVMVLFEDLHWTDAETQALLDSLVESLPTARVLLLVSYRPEYRHAWGSKTYYRQLQVDPLPPESAEAVLDALLGGDPALMPLKRLVIERTEGNPFFIEETVRALVETSVLTGERGTYRLTQVVQGLQVPATAQAMLAARIDRLLPEDKRLLQVASVVGKDVPLTLLQVIADMPDETLRRGLERLQAAEFLYEARLYPDLEYSFKHALTHDVTYSGLLHARRRELHARIVEAIETLHRQRLGEQIERLAHHALRGELREKAVHYLRQAGLKAAARSALAEARGWLEQALAVLAALPESQATLERAYDLRLELRPVLNLLGEARQALECLRAAETLAERLSDDHRRGRVCAFMTNIHTLLGEPEEALTTGTRGLEIARRIRDLRLRILTTTFLEQAHYFRGDYERVVELATDNLGVLPADWVYEDLGNVAPASVYDRLWLVMSFAQLGRFTEAAEYEAEAIRLAEPTHHAFTIGMAHLAASTGRLLAGDWATARRLIDHWIATVRAGNVVLLLSRAVACSAWVLAQLGEGREASERLREGMQLVESHTARGPVGLRAWAYDSLGRACLLLGRLDEARGLADRAVEFSPSQRGFAAHALQLLGDIATHSDRFDAARGEAYYREALALGEPRGMRPLVAHCHLGLGRLSRRAGDQAQAQGHLTTAATMYREMAMVSWLARAEAELGAVQA